METPIDPTSSARANYAAQLRWFRAHRKMSQAKLGEHPEVMVSGKTIEAVENMRRFPTRRLSVGVDKVFGTDLFKGLYASYLRESELPEDFVEYAELEELASQVKVYSQHGLNGLFQTEAWAREVLSGGRRKDRLQEAVADRIRRQEVLHRDPPPEVTALLDEAVVRKLIAVNREMAGDQIRHLIGLSEEPTITILIVPLSSRVYPEGAFNVLSFDTQPDVAYVDGAGGRGTTLEPGPQVTELAVTFDRIRGVGRTAPDSIAWLRSVLEEL